MSDQAPAWLLNSDGENATREIYEYYKTKYLESVRDLSKIKDPAVIARIDARANDFALRHTKALKDGAERSFVFQVYEASRTGWYRNLDAEFDTIEELLASIVDASEEGTTEAYNMAYLAETALPLMKQAGVDPNDVFALPFLTAKAQLIVPALRDIMSCPVCGARTRHNGTTCPNGHPLELSESRKEQAFSLARMVGNPEVSSNDIREKVSEIRGKVRHTLPPLLDGGTVCNMPGGEQWILVKVPNPDYTRAIEIKLKEILPEGISYTDIWALAQELNSKVMKTTPAITPW